MFTAYPVYPKYRALKVADPAMHGEDVYAIQCALNELVGAGLTTDGAYGPKTGQAVESFQTQAAASDPTIGDADGIAGSLTQRALTLGVCRLVSKESGIRYTALKGQTEFEAGYRPGIYSPLHNAGTLKQSWDSGAAQENSLVFDVKGAFTPLEAVRELAARIVEHRDHFSEIDGDRRLQLAQGSWNAPAWACHIAYEEGARNAWVAVRKSENLSNTQRAVIETYMAHVSVYYTP